MKSHWAVVHLLFLVNISASQGGSAFAAGNEAIQAALDPSNQVGEDYQSVMAGIRDYSEEANLRRYRLQLVLIDKEPVLRSGLETMFALLSSMYQNMQKVRDAVAKQTTIIDADASAGGLYAASRELMAEIPQTQKLMKKVFNDLYQGMQRDGKAINQTLTETEDDYRARMQASAQIISSLLAKMDHDFASKAYAQEMAMRQAVSNLAEKAKTSLMIQEQQTNKTRDMISQVSAAVSDSTSQVASVVSQLSLMPAEIQNTHKKKVAGLQADFQKSLSDAQAMADSQIQLNVDKQLASLQSQGMRIAQQFQREVTSTQDGITQKLSDVQDLVARETVTVQKSVNMTVAQISSQVRRIQDNSTRQIAQVGKKSDILTNDALKTASDSRDLLTELSSKLGMSRQDFITALGQVKAGLPNKLQSVLQRMLNVNQGMNSDLIQSLLKENGGIAYISQFTDQQLSQLGISLDSKLSSTQTSIANQGFNVKSVIDQLMASIDQNNRETNTNSALAVGKSQQSLQGILSAMGGSIDDLMSLLGDTSSTSKDSLNQIKQELLTMNSDSLAAVLNRVKELSSQNSDQMETFLTTVIGPDSALTESQFKQIAGTLTTLLSLEQSIEEEQNRLMASIQQKQSVTASNITNLSDRIGQATSRAMGLAQQIGATSEGRLATLKALLSSQSMKAADEAQSMASSSLNSIDSLFARLDQLSRGIHQTVSQSISGTQADLNQAGNQLSALGLSGAQSVNSLSALALSIINQAERQQGVDFSTAKSSIDKLRTDFIASFKERAKNTTDAALADVRSKLQNATQQEAALKTFVSSIEDTLSRMKGDIQVAGKYNDNQTAVFKNRISQAEQTLAQINIAIRTGLSETIDAFQKKLSDKETYLNVTGTDLNAQLKRVKDLVRKAQDQLHKNLQLYQAKIDGVVNEIRSYMNLSSAADELAVSNDIANQLAGVNATQIQLTNIHMGINESLVSMNTRLITTSNQSSSIIETLIQGAGDVAQSASDGRTANLRKLTAVGLSVDSQANALRTNILDSARQIEDAIHAGRNETAIKIADTEGTQAARLANIQRDAAGMESQARKRFIDNLSKIGGLNDDLGLTTKQLAQLLDNANATIDDISTSVMTHMDLGFQTMYDLNKAENRKIASVQDVMNAFSSVVLMFLNETEQSMTRVMNDMNLLDHSSKNRLSMMQGRTKDETSWLGTSMNSTVERFQLSLEQERAVQEGLKQAVTDAKKRLVSVRKREDADITSLTAQIGALENKIRKGGQDQIAKVRAWIAKRSPQLAQQLIGGSSFIEHDGHRKRRRHRRHLRAR